MIEQATLVVLYPKDHNGAFSDIPEFVKRAEASGMNVKVIGDGKAVLTLDYIQKEMLSVKGPAMLYIAAHGTNDSWVSDHEIGGITYGSAPDSGGLLEKPLIAVATFGGDPKITSAALFKLVPDNYKAVIMGSCYAASADNAASRFLPPNTLFFPGSSADQLGVGNTMPYLFDMMSTGGKPFLASDLYLAELLYGHTPSWLGYKPAPYGSGNRWQSDIVPIDEDVSAVRDAKRRFDESDYNNDKLSKEDRDLLIRSSETINRKNMPHTVVIAGVGSIDLDLYIHSFSGVKIPESMLLRIADRLEYAYMPLSGYPQLSDKNGYARDNTARIVRDYLRPIAERLQAGTIKREDPDYPYAIAMMYVIAEENYAPVFDNQQQFPLIVAPPTDTPDKVAPYGQNMYIPGKGLSGRGYQGVKFQSKFERELQGLALDLEDMGMLGIRYSDGSSKLDVDKDGHITDKDLKAIFLKQDIVRCEQIGNHDREISIQEFIDFEGGVDLPNIVKPKSEKGPPKRG